MRRNKKSLLVGIVLILIILYLAYRFNKGDDESIEYKTALVDKGEVKSSINTTGTVNPTNEVGVGSQVNGIIINLFVDFNSKVKKDEPLAEIGPAPLKSKLTQAEADLKKAKADLNLAGTIRNSNEELYRKNLISKDELDNSKAKYSNAHATYEQSQAAFDIAQSNLDNATIRSPIDGIIISRNLSVGQSINSGGSSQPLFVVAEDLARMKLVAHVSEADIGKVKEGQEAYFTVDAYQNERFKGVVSQIRNDPVVNNNVVTYDVIIQVENNELKLKPGMTAEVEILAANKKDVLRVPTSALRFIPPPSASIDQDSIDTNSHSQVWMITKNGRLRAINAILGISDETYTELMNSDISEGQQVIIEKVEKGNAGSEELGPLILPKPKRF